MNFQNRYQKIVSAVILTICLSVRSSYADSFVATEMKDPLSVYSNHANEIVIVVQPELHTRYGFLYPITFQFEIPENSNGLTVSQKNVSSAPWENIIEKTADDFFNGIEAVRFDYTNNRAYVSVAFSFESDSLFLQMRNSSATPIVTQYKGITKYYDNRDAAVTVTADDWADWSDSMWDPLLTLFRSYGLYVTVGIISDSAEWCSPQTWKHIQQQVDSGFIEVASHSRTHPQLPYSNYTSEVIGGYDDIIKNLTLSPMFRYGTKQYVYVWVAPYGSYNLTIDTILAQRSYLVPRLAGIDGEAYSAWNTSRNHFEAIHPTFEIGKPSWGGGDTDQVFLKAKFDRIVSEGGVYHFMWHPQVIYADRAKPYLLNHLSHVSKRKNIWYVNFGHLYLYRYLQQRNDLVATLDQQQIPPTSIELYQNFPNPFNPTTNIQFSISGLQAVTLKVYDVLGKEIASIIERKISQGFYQYSFDASQLPNGIYFYRLSAGNFHETKKMILAK